jgi:hypothetical protein
MREDLEAENIDLEDLSLIDEAFQELVDAGVELRDLPENAMAVDKLDEIEDHLPETAWIIYDYVCQNFGDNEADDPSWYITPLAFAIEAAQKDNKYREDVRQGRNEI